MSKKARNRKVYLRLLNRLAKAGAKYHNDTMEYFRKTDFTKYLTKTPKVISKEDEDSYTWYINNVPLKETK